MQPRSVSKQRKDVIFFKISPWLCVCLFFCHYLSCTAGHWSVSQLPWDEVMVTPWAGRPGPQPSTLTFTPTDTFEVPIRVGNQPNVNDCRRKPEYLAGTHRDAGRTPNLPLPKHAHVHAHRHAHREGAELESNPRRRAAPPRSPHLRHVYFNLGEMHRG